MNRQEAIEILSGRYLIAVDEDSKTAKEHARRVNEALDLAIEALKGDLYCPKCGTIVRDGRQYHDLVYRGEAEPIKGDAESATTTDEDDCISRQAAIEALTGWETDPTDEEIVRTLKALPPVEPKIYGNEHNCIMTIFGECSYSETGCGSCAVVEKVRDALAKTQMKTQNSNENSNEDAISRADTIKAMCADCEAFFGDDTNCADCDNVAVVKSMPPVEPERPKGRWIDIDLKPAPNGVPFEKCENCREWSAQLNKNFCPNCGADMSRYER